jgi:glycosyltransferase involved in cell wall biosynthesis
MMQTGPTPVPPPHDELPRFGEATAHVDLDVLFVLNSLAIGGSESKVVRLANSLQARGAQVGLAYLNEPYSLLKQIDPDIPAWHLARKGKLSIAAIASLRQLIVEQRSRTLVAVNSYPALYVLAATRWMRDRPRTIGLVNTSVFAPGERWRRSFYCRVLRSLDWTVYGCELQRTLLVPESNPMRARSCVIYNGVDLDRFSRSRDSSQIGRQRARLGIGQDSLIVGTVGRLAPEKNQLPLLDALARARKAGTDAHLLIVGDGAMRKMLEERAAVLGVSRHVTFTGTQTDVRPLLAVMDVFVLPSSSIETFSSAALEAMAMRIPVILARTGAAAEMINDGDEGFLLDVGELGERLPALLQTLARDQDSRRRMGAAALRRVERDFSWDAMVTGYVDLFAPRRRAHHA